VFQIGTRQASTMLQLKDGENQVLAGLINDTESNSGNNIPGIGDLPLLDYLFGSKHGDHSKSEIVLSITPHIVRSVQRPELSVSEFSAGTESSFRRRPDMTPRLPTQLPGNARAGQPASALPAPAYAAPAGRAPMPPTQTQAVRPASVATPQTTLRASAPLPAAAPAADAAAQAPAPAAAAEAPPEALPEPPPASSAPPAVAPPPPQAPQVESPGQPTSSLPVSSGQPAPIQSSLNYSPGQPVPVGAPPPPPPVPADAPK
jgi:general secretion pathway protein D